MVTSLSIADLFRNTFGYTSPAFEFDRVPNPGDGSRKERADLGSPYYAMNELGREYYMPVTLGGMQLPHPVIAIDGHKNIVRTPLTKRRGTFKQAVNIDDYQITIRGLIISRNREFPEAILQQLRELFERPGALEIRCPITDVFLVTPGRQGFDQVVIEDFRFPPTVGVMNARGYELRMFSDEPFNLIEKA